MKNFFFFALAIFFVNSARAQDAASTPASSPDMNELRQPVKALTATVKTPQHQVKDQQTTIDKLNQPNEAVAESPEPSPVAAASASPSPSAAAKAPGKFATEDASVVSSTSNAPSAPSGSNVNANGTALSGNFPTSDTSVVSSAPETISSTGAGASLTQPISIGGGKNYMNLSFDGLFALAGSSARDLDHIEVGYHDPQQRGFNARNIELAFDGAVDPYFECFANIVFKLNNDNGTEVE